MDFRDYAAGEVSELFGRLVTTHSDATLRTAREALAAAAAALDASAHARPDHDGAVHDLVKRLADAATRDVERARAEVEQARAEFEKDIHTLRARAESIREELETESARAATIEADLDAVIEAHRQVDASRVQAEAERDEQARARTAAEDELATTRELLEAARAEALRLKEALDTESAQRALIEAQLAEELENTRQQLGPAREDVIRLQSALDAETERRIQLEAAMAEELAEARASVEPVRAEVGRLQQELEHARSAVEPVRAEAARLQQALDDESERRVRIEADLGEELESMRQLLAPARSEVARLQEQVAIDAEHRAALEAELAEARAAAGTAGGRADTDVSPLSAALDAVDDLSAAATVTDLLGGAARHLGSRFDRVAIFRVRGHHLEGEHGCGLDAHMDVTKLSIPLGVDSVITRAASHGVVETASGAQLAQIPTPLGGQPEVALALPVPFQGETFAVAYVDAGHALAPGMPEFAALIVKHTSILLTRLTQELKTAKELGDYASLLLQEAEHMFQADLEGGRPEHERRHRLHETLECARQLYAQRAALEGSAAARLLEDQISAIISSPQQTPFAKDLAAACLQSESRRNAS